MKLKLKGKINAKGAKISLKSKGACGVNWCMYCRRGKISSLGKREKCGFRSFQPPVKPIATVSLSRSQQASTWLLVERIYCKVVSWRIEYSTTPAACTSSPRQGQPSGDVSVLCVHAPKDRFLA